jgi:hypothetical protein
MPAFTVVTKASDGTVANIASSGVPTIVSSASTVVASGICARDNDATYGSGTTGYYGCSFTTASSAKSGDKATLTIRVPVPLSSPTTYYSVTADVTLGGSVATETVTFDKSSYSPGEGMVVTRTAKDSSGNPVYDYAPAVALTGNKNIGAIAAGSYLILCAEKDTTLYSSYGKVIGIPLWPDLNNENDILILRNNKGKEIHKVRYSSNWYQDSEKRKGGYTLELIDPESICIGSQNWKASTDSSGGTPGRMNSWYHTNFKSDVLKLIEIEVLDSLKILLTFNNTVDSVKASSNSNYFINNGVGNPIKSQIIEPDFNQILLTFRERFSKGQTYRLITNTISDCKNGTIPAEFNSLEFTISRDIGKNDILITEILFNPRPEGSDFVEILNNSDHVLDLKDLYIARITKDSINSTQIGRAHV